MVMFILSKIDLLILPSFDESASRSIIKILFMIF